ncbi:MAG TPA: phosphoribosylformylglycinamidine synthase subunit PurQ [Candidatus Polarisedimenticolia bacterium]|nr:phosphoribosylformylglycinamidine synthase subunit PurQ [Candidatus Polarisedimenticolia bacterium]
MKFGIVIFPGSNCDHDVYHVAKHVLGQEAAFLWHKATTLGAVDCVVLPGGFAHGDYLRAGAMARFSPIMKAVEAFARRGGMVFGICNGFQVLCEAGLLPGALMRNSSLHYVCRDVFLRTERQDTPYTARIKQGTVLKIPIGHGEGCYVAPEETLKELEQKRQVVFRYCDAGGQVTTDSNPNGSLRAIAGVCNERGNVLGMMPHPDRSAEEILGNAQGRRIFESIVHAWQQARRTRI